MRLKPHIRVEIKIHVLDAEVAGDPGAVNNHSHRDLVQFFQARGLFENFPLFRSHNLFQSNSQFFLALFFVLKRGGFKLESVFS